MSINDILASLYENDWLFHQTFSVELYQNGAYLTLFLVALFPSLLTTGVFYFLIKYPYCKWYHWLITLLIGILATGILTKGILRNFLAVPLVNGADGITGFLLNMIIFNSLLSLVVGFIATLIFKRYHGAQRNIPWGK